MTPGLSCSCCKFEADDIDDDEVFDNAGIDNDNDNEEIDNSKFKCLLLGAGNVGKSTIFKQMNIGEYNRDHYFDSILMDNFRFILTCYKRYLAEIEGDEEAAASLGLDKSLLEYHDEIEMANRTKMLQIFQTDAFAQFWEKMRKFDHPELHVCYECFDYFYPRIQELLSQEKLTPSNDTDAIMTRVRTTGIVESKVEMEPGKTFFFYDNGGERNERKKWIHMFENVRVMVYVTDLTAFARTLFEDDEQNSEKEMVVLFEELASNRYFTKSPIHLILNKSDIFRSLLQHKDPSYNHPLGYSDGNNYEAAVEFIAREYGNVCRHRCVLAAVTNSTSPSFREHFLDGISYLLREYAFSDVKIPIEINTYEPMLICGHDILYPLPQLGDLKSELFLFGYPKNAKSWEEICKVGVINAGDLICDQLAEILPMMPKLTTLVMSEGSITTAGFNTIISKISELQLGITRINFICNNISNISTCFQILSLEEIDVCGNPLTDPLSEKISRLKNLRVLSMLKSQVKTLPAALCRCSKLEVLEVPQDKMVSPSSEICSRGINAMIRFLSALMQGQEKNTRIRLMVVGLGEVGKTSLIQALTNLPGQSASPNVSSQIDPDNRTIGIDVHRFHTQHESNLEFDIWDFAGQKVYYLTHSFFLSRRSLFVLAWRVLPEAKYRKGAVCAACGLVLEGMCLVQPGVGECHEECVDYQSTVFDWIRKLQYRVPGASIMMVATHADVVAKPVIERQIQKIASLVTEVVKYHEEYVGKQLKQLDKQLTVPGRSRDWYLLTKRRRDALASFKTLNVWNEGVSVAVSSKNGENIDYLRREIVKMAISLPFFGEKLPKSFFVLRDVIGEMRLGCRWVPLGVFREKCVKAGVGEHGADVELVVDYLRDIGELMYFPEYSDILKDTVIIDPKWAANLMKGLVCHDHNEISRVPTNASTKSSSSTTTTSVFGRAMRQLQRHGVLDPIVLEVLWEGTATPEEHPRLLDLLQALEVIIPDNNNNNNNNEPSTTTNDNNNNNFMVPCLLTDARTRPLHNMNFSSSSSDHRNCRFIYDSIPEGFYPRLLARLKRYSSHVTFSSNAALLYFRGEHSDVYLMHVSDPLKVFRKKQKGVFLNRSQVHVVVRCGNYHHFLLYKKQLDLMEEFFPGLVQQAAVVQCCCVTCASKNSSKNKKMSGDDNPHYFNLTEIGEDLSSHCICPLSRQKLSVGSLLPPHKYKIMLSIPEILAAGAVEDENTKKSISVLQHFKQELTSHNLIFATTQSAAFCLSQQQQQQQQQQHHHNAEITRRSLVFVPFLDQTYNIENSTTMIEYQTAVAKNTKSNVIIPLILPSYGPMKFPEWWLNGMQGLDGLLFVDLRDANSMRPTVANTITQIQKFLETSSSTGVARTGSDEVVRTTSDVSEGLGRFQSESNDNPGMLMCPSCLNKGIVPPHFFSRDEVVDEYKSAKLTILCGIENELIRIVNIMPAEIFISYNWGCQISLSGSAVHGTGSTAKFENQERIKVVKSRLEKEADVICWLDIERMGGGNVLDDEMKEGVKCCCIVLLCLDDAYTKSRNCLKELAFSVQYGRHVIPLLMPGLQSKGSDGHWCPDEVKELRGFKPVMYLENDIDKTISEIVGRIDALLRRDTIGSSVWRIAEQQQQQQQQQQQADETGVSISKSTSFFQRASSKRHLTDVC